MATSKAVRKSDKSSAKSSAPGRPFVPGDPRRAQPRGPAKGSPNAGRPPSVIREVYRLAAADRVRVLTDCIDGKIEGATPSDQMKAWDLLNKYGLGTTITPTDGEGKDAVLPCVVILPAQT